MSLSDPDLEHQLESLSRAAKEMAAVTAALDWGVDGRGGERVAATVVEDNQVPSKSTSTRKSLGGATSPRLDETAEDDDIISALTQEISRLQDDVLQLTDLTRGQQQQQQQQQHSSQEQVHSLFSSSQTQPSFETVRTMERPTRRPAPQVITATIPSVRRISEASVRSAPSTRISMTSSSRRGQWERNASSVSNPERREAWNAIYDQYLEQPVPPPIRPVFDAVGNVIASYGQSYGGQESVESLPSGFMEVDPVLLESRGNAPLPPSLIPELRARENYAALAATAAPPRDVFTPPSPPTGRSRGLVSHHPPPRSSSPLSALRALSNAPPPVRVAPSPVPPSHVSRSSTTASSSQRTPAASSSSSPALGRPSRPAPLNFSPSVFTARSAQPNQVSRPATGERADSPVGSRGSRGSLVDPSLLSASSSSIAYQSSPRRGTRKAPRVTLLHSTPPRRVRGQDQGKSRNGTAISRGTTRRTAEEALSRFRDSVLEVDPSLWTPSVELTQLSSRGRR